MALTNQVRNFFKARIQKALDEKKAVVEARLASKVDIDGEAVKRFVAKNACEDVLVAIQKRKELKLEKDRLQNELDINCKALRGRFDALGMEYRYDDEFESRLKWQALLKYKNEILAEHPEEVAELKRLDAMRDDIEGAILLATTEQKLLASLTKLLERYGADLGDLKDISGLV